MTDGLRISATGIQAAVTRLDVVSNNLANLTTPGFKPSRVDQISLRGGGTAVSATRLNFSEGAIELNDEGFALAIRGQGFFQLDSPAGLRFTRSGSFHLDAAGNLVNALGLLLSPRVQVPTEAQSIVVTGDGRVLALFGDGTVSQVGQIQTFSFADPGALLAEEGNLFAPGPASGVPELLPSDEVVFGALESSTTDLAGESLSSFLTRAAFEANVAALNVQEDTEGSLLDILG